MFYFVWYGTILYYFMAYHIRVRYHTIPPGKMAWHVDVGTSSDDSAHQACGIFLVMDRRFHLI